MCMERDAFKCTICGCGGELQVHHKEMFIDILKRFIKINNIESKLDDKFNYDDETHLKLREDVINYHNSNLDMGMTVCPQCHSDIDYYYKRYKIKEYKGKK